MYSLLFFHFTGMNLFEISIYSLFIFIVAFFPFFIFYQVVHEKLMTATELKRKEEESNIQVNTDSVFVSRQ